VLATDLLTDDVDASGAAGERARADAHARIQATKRAEFHAPTSTTPGAVTGRLRTRPPSSTSSAARPADRPRRAIGQLVDCRV